MRYYVLRDNKADGPYTFGQIQEMWNSSLITSETLHSQEGGSEWCPLSAIIHKLEPGPAPPLIPVGLGLVAPLQQFAGTPAPPKRPNVGLLGWLLILLGAFVVVGMMITLATLRARVNSTSSAPIELEAFIAKYGPPDKEESTAYDTPRPPIVTRFLIYQPERVRAVYLPEGKVGDPPPYRRWKLLGFQDSEDDHVLKRSEVDERLRNRKGR